LEISDKNLDDIQKDLGFFYFDNNFYKKSSTNKCYLTGAFLSNGSVSTQNSKISLIELTTNKQKYLKIIKSILNKYNIKINQIIKPNEYIIHIKNNSSILDFLKIVNAHQCMLDYETKIIETNRFAKINRINNLELSNLKKTSITNYKQIEMIKQIINSEEYEKQNQKFKSYCNARLAYPDYSLTDIIRFFNDDLGIKISKSALNHYSIKIKKIFNSK
jgi:DNA-binding protein WhiA